MDYIAFTELVLRAFASLNRGTDAIIGADEIAEALGIDPQGDGLTHAIDDLDRLGVITNDSYSYIKPTSFLERVRHAGATLPALWPRIFEVFLTPDQAAFLATLVELTHVRLEETADTTMTQALDVYAALGWSPEDVDPYRLVDALVTAGFVQAWPETGNSIIVRATYAGVVFASQPDARDEGIDAGLLDWSVATPGFEQINDRLAELKVRLASAQSDDDLSDVGRRCRDIAADAVDVVYRSEMLQDGEPEPSRQDAAGRLAVYLRARLPGEDFEQFRSFVKATLKLANARTHSARTGRSAAIASAQGLLALVRTLEAIERFSPGSSRS